MKRLTRIDRPEMKLLLRDLDLGGATVFDLVAVLKISRRNVDAYLRVARDAGLIRVVAWERVPGPHRPVFGLKTSSFQRDAPQLPRIQKVEANRNWRARRRHVCEMSPSNVSARWGEVV